MTILAGKFVWFEHVSKDVAAARKFYEALFGWTTAAVDMGGMQYHMAKNAGEDVADFRPAEGNMPSHWASWVSVADVDATVAKATKAGAKLVMEPANYPIGRGAAIIDPQGAAVALWTSKSGDKPDVERAPVGAWCWNELMTTDAVAALRFYESVFGYQHDEMPMPEGMYYILKANGVGRAGLMKAPPNVPSNWMPYIAVADPDATAAKAKSLGATIAVPATDIPNVGRFACLSDPLGAAIGVIRIN